MWEMQELQEQIPVPEAACAILFDIGLPGDHLIQLLHKFANARQAKAPIVNNSREHVHFCHADSVTLLIFLNEEGAFVNAKPALNHFIKAPAVAGGSINFYDDMVVVAHHRIATNVDRKHGRE